MLGTHWTACLCLSFRVMSMPYPPPSLLPIPTGLAQAKPLDSCALDELELMTVEEEQSNQQLFHSVRVRMCLFVCMHVWVPWCVRGCKRACACEHCHGHGLYVTIGKRVRVCASVHACTWAVARDHHNCNAGTVASVLRRVSLLVQWAPGSRGAHAMLQAFVLQRLRAFNLDRAKTDRNSTSCLSPHVHFGEVSVRQIYYVVSPPAIMHLSA